MTNVAEHLAIEKKPVAAIGKHRMQVNRRSFHSRLPATLEKKSYSARGNGSISDILSARLPVSPSFHGRVRLSVYGLSISRMLTCWIRKTSSGEIV